MEILTRRPAARSADSIAHEKAVLSGIVSMLMMPLEMVSTTLPPVISAPAISQMAAMMRAAASGMALAPTAGPTLFVTSFAPILMAI